MIRNTKDAEDTLKNYEARLRDVSKVPSEEKEVEAHRTQLKVFPLIGKITVYLQHELGLRPASPITGVHRFHSQVLILLLCWTVDAR